MLKYIVLAVSMLALSACIIVPGHRHYAGDGPQSGQQDSNDHHRDHDSDHRD